MKKPEILAMWGSNSSRSINGKLIAYASTLYSKVEVNVIDLKDYNMPLFGVDLEREKGHPKEAKELKKLIENCNGIMLSLAEHNGAYSAFFKNIFDWISRLEGKVWDNKPIFLMGASDGKRGAKSVISIAENRFPFNGGKVIQTYSFPNFNDNFDDDKGIIDENLRVELKDLIQKFEVFILEEMGVLSKI